MKRNFITALAVCYTLTTGGLAIYAQEQGYYGKKVGAITTNKSEAVTLQDKTKKDIKNTNANKDVYVETVHKEVNSADKGTIAVGGKNKAGQAPLSRGSVSTSKSQDNKVSAKQITASTNSTKVELLDWWKSAQYVFSVGREVTVRDVNTGKTFKIKRTMGTNHADCETVTAADTKIMREIWGGFSWTRRPVHIIVDGRVLAASMAGMPHAGLDAAPAYSTVNNRAGGFGRGQNLDVVKGNGMDGHFDVHFLNSKTHGSSKVDPDHQAAIMKAAGK